jgi:hypothetical protein
VINLNTICRQSEARELDCGCPENNRQERKKKHFCDINEVTARLDVAVVVFSASELFPKAHT